MTAATLVREGDLIRIAGPATMETVPALAAAGSRHFAEGASRVSFAAVTEVDSAAVAMLLDWLRDARKRGRSFVVEGVPSSLENLARLYAVADVLEIKAR